VIWCVVSPTVVRLLGACRLSGEDSWLPGRDREIEAALRGQPGVQDAAVSVLRREGSTVLVGFVVWRENTVEDPVLLRPALTEHLPSYMIPSRIVALPELPVNANGKLDGHVLNQLAEGALSSVIAGGTESASTDTERSLCELFAEQFNGLAPHIDDDFFLFGLDSIVAISLVHKARRRGLSLSPRMVFTAPTIRQLAAAIDAAVDSDTNLSSAEYGEVLPLRWCPGCTNTAAIGASPTPSAPVAVRHRPPVHRADAAATLDGHDTLRSILIDTPAGPRLVTREPGVVNAGDLLTRVELSTPAIPNWSRPSPIRADRDG